MTIEQQIQADIISAMKEKNATKLTALRGLKGAITLVKTEKGKDTVLTDAEVLTIIQKQIKNRKEVSETYASQGREDLVAIELGEVKDMEKYLPAQLTAEEVTPIIKAVVERVGATSLRDMGKVMGDAEVVALAGQVDKKTISEIIKAQFA